MPRILKAGARARQNREAASRRRARSKGLAIPFLMRRRNVDGEIIPQHGALNEYVAHGCRCDPCKAAKRADNKKHYIEDDVARSARGRRYRESKAQITRNAKRVPCYDCGAQYPYYVMQFDHIGEKKIKLNSSSVWSAARQAVIDEMKKCEVVCSNCHHIRTHQRVCPQKFMAATMENYGLQFGRWLPQST